MSAPRRDISQSPDPNSGHGMGGGSMKNGTDMVQNGPVLQDYDQWRSPHSVYSPNAGFGPLSSQPTAGDYVTSYYTTSPYDHPGWTTAPPSGFYHSQGFSPPVGNHFVDHMTLFGGGPPPAPGGNSIYYNYFPPSPANGSDYGSWGGAPIIATPRTAASKHSEFYYNTVIDGGYTHYVGTDIGGGGGVTNGSGRTNDAHLGYLEHGVANMAVCEDTAGQHGARGDGHQCRDTGTGAGLDIGRNVSSNSAEPKRKSWATIASQPAKANCCSGISGPLPGGARGRGRVPIGGVPGSASTDSSAGGHTPIANDASTGFWTSPSTKSTAPLAGMEKQEQNGVSAPTNTRGGGGGESEIWTSNAPSGKAASSLTPSAQNVDSCERSSPQTQQLINGVNGGEKQSNTADSKSTQSTSAMEKTNSVEKGRVTLDTRVYNPKEFNLPMKGARFFVIKSYSEDDIHRSIKYGIWCSTEHGNKRLDSAYKELEGKGPLYLLYSVNGSGHFCGIAQMTSPLDYTKSSSVWAQDKWKGQFTVKWIYVKDVPNAQLRHIRLENNENKPVTNSRDTQEVPPQKGQQVLKIIHHYRHTTSLFDDFSHYEKRQEEENVRKARRPTSE